MIKNPDQLARKIARRSLDVKQKKRRRLFSVSARRMLRKAFGKRFMPFFDLYVQLRGVYYGEALPPEEGFSKTFRIYAKQIHRRLDRDESQRAVRDLLPQMVQILKRIDRQTKKSGFLFKDVIQRYAEFIKIVAADRDIFFVTKVLKYPGFVRFIKARPEEEELLRLKRDNPELYEAKKREQELRRKLDQRIEKEVEKSGYKPGRKPIHGRVVITGTDKVTGEELVFDRDGDVIPVDEFVSKLKQQDEEIKRLQQTRVFPNEKVLEDLRTFDMELVDKYAEFTEPTYQTLSDDEEKANSLTRIYPVIEIFGEMVVSEGRYKGFVLSDLVNTAGRMIEGTAYEFDHKTGRRTKLEQRDDQGNLKVPLGQNREPYLTRDGDQLHLSIPSTHDEMTEIRRAVRAISKVSEGVTYIDGTANQTFRIDPEEFISVRNALRSFSMSEGATTMIEEYFEELTKAELAIKKENLVDYTTKELGGFKEDSYDLYTKQKESLAWLDSRGGNGLIALETGVGKCVRGDTLILTDRGLVPISEMNPGVTTPDTDVPVKGWKVFLDGDWVDVSRFYYGGHKPTRKLTTRHGFELEGSLVHPVLTRRKDGEAFVKLPDLREGDYICIERRETEFPQEEPKLNIPDINDFGSNAVEYEVRDTLTPDLSRLFAYIVGEGCTSPSITKGFQLSQCPTKNPEVLEDIVNLLASELGWEYGNKDLVKDFFVNSVFLRKYLESNDFGMCISKGKRVPSCIFNATKESARQFLRGMFEGEGTVSDGSKVEFYSASKELTQGIQQLLLRFGIISNLSEKVVKGYEHNQYWRLLVSGTDCHLFQQRIGFVSERKNSKLEEVLSDNKNPNLDVIPFINDLIQEMRSSIFDIVGGSKNKYGGFANFLGDNLRGKIQHIKHGRRNATYSMLNDLLHKMEELNLTHLSSYQDGMDIYNHRYFYDKIVTLENDYNVVMDIEVDHPDHYFVGNGIINHNTLTSIGYIQDLTRKGLLDGENDKVLYVCPAKLKGNLQADAKDWIEDMDVFDANVEYMSYTKLSQSPLDILDQYVAVIFDEAQKLKNVGTTKRGKIVNRPHPRKVLMTASPMEKDPKEVFNLACIANNIDLRSREGRRLRRNFEKRFCEKIGSRVVGVKNDPEAQKQLRIWIKQNLFHGGKQDVEEVTLPHLRRSTKSLTMDREVEEMYREITDSMKFEMEGLVRLFRDKNQNARSPRITGAMQKFKKKMVALTNLSNMPDLMIPGATNPKIEESANIIEERIESRGKTLMFTSSPDFASYTAKELSLKFPGTLHVSGLSKKIEVWRTGELVETYTERVYRDPEPDGPKVPSSGWAKHVMDTYVKTNHNVVSCTLTDSYAAGQNLQEFDTVVQLDRAANSEIQKQRVSRAYRNGQKKSVKEYTLDTVYSEPENSDDRTFDEIKRYIQDMEEELFEKVVVESQKEILGEDYFAIQNVTSDFVKADKKSLEMLMSPYMDDLRGLYEDDLQFARPRE